MLNQKITIIVLFIENIHFCNAYYVNFLAHKGNETQKNSGEIPNNVSQPEPSSSGRSSQLPSKLIVFSFISFVFFSKYS